MNPAHCPDAPLYRRPTGELVCLGCASVLQPGEEIWEPQFIAYCAEGLHHWSKPPYSAGNPTQCIRCPAVRGLNNKGGEYAEEE
jgi:hypothetical protein